ncbi:MAG: 4-hydroxythreonine-4-phosphate dehydrogenase PdxA [Acidobacteria bacterium]|nr:4-hydroxythreonine-4-phosphate dehydrogenase PdxA [Acidobacteriota bacterium]
MAPARKEPRASFTFLITPGDPAGIGPEVTLKALADEGLSRDCRWIVVADATFLREVSRSQGLPFPLRPCSDADWVSSPGTLLVLDQANVRWSVRPGRVDKRCGKAAGQWIEKAVALLLAGRADGMVTGPLHKQAFQRAGYPFPGHTEFLAALTRRRQVAMAFFADRLRVVLLTTHLSLRGAIAQLRRPRVEAMLELIHREFARLGFPRPRIAVAGLNPHAGEGGLLGREETAVLEPAIRACRRRRIRAEGPFPPDTIFLRAARGEFDVVVACYHDQGLIPVKLLAQGAAVNLTLGLPFLRTSVDHGTAFDIAGRGKADPSSMMAAMRLIRQLAESTKKT